MRISVTKISTYLDCPRKYWYRYTLYLQTPKSEGFYFGSAIHKGLENYYTGKDPMKGVVDALFQERDRVSEKPKEGINLARLEKEAKRIFQIYPSEAPYFKPILVEHFFKVPLVHPTTKEELPAIFTGKMDLITEDGAVVDHKTASRSPNGFFEAKNTLQANGYSYAYFKMFGVLPTSFIFNTIIKGNSRREPRLVHTIRKPTLGDLCYFVDTCKHVLGAIIRKETQDYPNRYHCRYCAFKDICPHERKLK